MLDYLRGLLGSGGLAEAGMSKPLEVDDLSRAHTGPGSRVDEALDVPDNETDLCDLPILPEMRPFGWWHW